jgi:hypothetical protein
MVQWSSDGMTTMMATIIVAVISQTVALKTYALNAA